jgi:hypothetical protein
MFEGKIEGGGPLRAAEKCEHETSSHSSLDLKQDRGRNETWA